MGRSATADSVCQREPGHAQSSDGLWRCHGALCAARPAEEMPDQAAPLGSPVEGLQSDF